MTRPDPSHYGTDGNRHALDARDHDDEQDDETPRSKMTPRKKRMTREDE